MKTLRAKLLFTLSLMVPFSATSARGNETLIVGQPTRPDDERVIRDFENQNAVAMLHLDYATLERLWSEHFVVSTPSNMIAPSRDAVFEQFRKSDGPIYSSYEKKIESIVFDGDVTIVMGAETVVPRHLSAAGKPVRRRYTNIWKRDQGTWRLIARQATTIPNGGESGSAGGDALGGKR